MISSLIYGTDISKKHIAFVLRSDSLFYTEVGGRNVFRIVDSFLPNYKASRSKECNLYNEYRQNVGFRILI
jgi:hypothetical protein